MIETDKTSKSAKKRAAQRVKKMGVKLLSMNAAFLEKADLSDRLRQAITFHKTIASNEAKRRHLQWISRLLREDKSDLLLMQLETGAVENTQYIENTVKAWCQRFIDDGDAVLSDFIKAFPTVDKQALRQYIRNARKQSLKLDSNVVDENRAERECNERVVSESEKALYRFVRKYLVNARVSDTPDR